MERKFFHRDTRKVAEELIGCKIVKKGLKAEIVETEAYMGEKDPASHAFNGKTERNKVMYGKPGKAYVYLCYGIHRMFNVVAHTEEKPGAVLIRAAKPLNGKQEMKDRRGVEEIGELCNGPGKLCEAFNIDRSDKGADLTEGEFRLEKAENRQETVKTSRIGISQGLNLEYRFLVKDSRFTST